MDLFKTCGVLEVKLKKCQSDIFIKHKEYISVKYVGSAE